tara:strand:+ start:38919 stop:39251 length:333 start_codon:yes stop_codon:yes gene_type:complete
VQLSEYTPKFEAIGIKVLTVTYDSQADAKKFYDRNQLAYPILFDEQSTLIKELGILNTGPKPGDAAYGIPYPGLFLVDSDGKVFAKFAEKSFKDRPNYDGILSTAEKLSQ